MDLAARRAYFDDYGDTIEEMPPSLVAYGLRFPCERCGYPTLRSREDPCELCASEDVPREITDAFDAMPRTPAAQHEPLWAAVTAGMQKLVR